MIEKASSVDGLLNRRVMLEQPEVGYRVAVDTVLLAAAVPALEGDRILDLGCGVGGAMLCLACRVPNLCGVGVDILSNLVAMATRNIGRNAFASGLEAMVGDAAALSSSMVGCFDHVLMNPPYHEEKRHDASANDIKHTANLEKPGDLPRWISSAYSALKPSGMLSMIHRADRLEEILLVLKKPFGSIDVMPILPKTGHGAKRVLVRARKNDACETLRPCAPLVLHGEGGGYTENVEAVLRNVEPLVFTA